MIQFKTPRVRTDYAQLLVQNTKLHAVIEALHSFCLYELGKSLMLTEIYRSEEEYQELYKDDLSKLPADRPHAFWKGADLRSSDFTQPEIERMLKFLNQFTYCAGQKPVGMYHTISGNVYHFHIQAGLDGKGD